MTDASDDRGDSQKNRAEGMARAKALRDQARGGGLRVEVYLPPGLAGWLFALIENGTFCDPSEAVFAILMEHKALAAHSHLRMELLRHACQAEVGDAHSATPDEGVSERLRKFLQALSVEPAVWRPTP
jgi:antitoxin ParD1/3/4